ncbi:P-type conjugative transfer protein TrbG [Pelagibacterium lentulum]|uniref:Conjugal transfer protein TrbG n=1 Tax=Pelagibacterium lentulum TaxID=2029865 RepID=A0A916RP01_9HYPH|nr:P-type conjugative transfer protein TrbG [Pelagibacterium lentulum]GGA64430.1 conjugal transfer protein TrbG [Pelagibacterium lentulum]
MFNTIKIRAGVGAIALIAASLALSTATAADQNAQRGTALSSQWQNQAAVMTRGADGTVIYLYGETQPTVICAPLQLCEIALQAGEAVRDVLVGDTVRWQVEPASSGSPEGPRIHLIVKPAEAGLKTSMVVTTSRRTYHINLESRSSGYMARVAFTYPEDIRQQIAAVNQRIEASIIPGAGVPAENLNFNFSMSGNARWKPTRIYTDGMKTYIQFPGHLGSGDAPILFIQSGGQQQIVNYRLNGNMMIVDYLIDRAVLVSGVGNQQQRVTIQRRG